MSKNPYGSGNRTLLFRVRPIDVYTTNSYRDNLQSSAVRYGSILLTRIYFLFLFFFLYARTYYYVSSDLIYRDNRSDFILI